MLAEVVDAVVGVDTHRIDTTRKIRNHVSGLTALGFRVTLEPAG